MAIGGVTDAPTAPVASSPSLATTVAVGAGVPAGGEDVRTEVRERQRLARRLLGRCVVNLTAVIFGVMVFRHIHGVIRESHLIWAFVFLLVAIMVDLTHARRRWGFYEEVVLAVRVATMALLVTSALGLLFNDPLSRLYFATVAGVMLAVRPLAGWALNATVLTDDRRFSAAMICDDAEYQEVLDEVSRDRYGRVRSLVRLDDRRGEPTEQDEANATTFAGPVEGLLSVCAAMRSPVVVVGASRLRDPLFVEAITAANECGIQVRSFPRFFEETYGRVPIVSIDTTWFLFDIGPLHNAGYRLVRRAFDLVSGLIVASALLILLPFVALAIRLDSPGPVFFNQVRVGRAGSTIRVRKFRTMCEGAERDGPQFASAGDARITRVGELLRRTRFDELPQAVNLIEGTMSLIGPRPERPEFVEEFTKAIPFYDKRHLVQPGLTGWAQVHEGYSTSVEDTIRKLERDLYYVKHQSYSLDLRIMSATVRRMVSCSGR